MPNARISYRTRCQDILPRWTRHRLVQYFFVKKDVSKGLAGFLSIRFPSRFAANVSMLYSPDPAASPGRSYLENFSSRTFYNSIKDCDDIVAPVQEKSINKFQVRRLAVGISIPIRIQHLAVRASPLGPISDTVVHSASVQGA